MVWGFITSTGHLEIFRINGTMNSVKYTSLLESVFLDKLVELGFKIGDVVFVQDNAPCHTSSHTKEWFKNHNLNVLKWPPQSPDMNPIENVWYVLETNSRKRQSHFKNLDELWEVLLQESKKIDPAYIKKLFKSIPARINALKAFNFDATKY